MRISPINSLRFKGLLSIPASSSCYDEKAKSPLLEVETDNIIEIDNRSSVYTEITYIDENNDKKYYTFYKDRDKPFDQSRILLAYAAAAANRDVIIKA